MKEASRIISRPGQLMLTNDLQFAILRCRSTMCQCDTDDMNASILCGAGKTVRTLQVDKCGDRALVLSINGTSLTCNVAFQTSGIPDFQRLVIRTRDEIGVIWGDSKIDDCSTVRSKGCDELTAISGLIPVSVSEGWADVVPSSYGNRSNTRAEIFGCVSRRVLPLRGHLEKSSSRSCRWYYYNGETLTKVRDLG